MATLAEDSIPGLGSPGRGGGTSAVLGEPFGRARAPSATVRTDGEVPQMVAEFDHPVAKRVGRKSGQAVIEPRTTLPCPVLRQLRLATLRPANGAGPPRGTVDPSVKAVVKDLAGMRIVYSGPPRRSVKLIASHGPQREDGSCKSDDFSGLLDEPEPI